MRLPSRRKFPGSITATRTTLRRVGVAVLAFVLPALSLSETHAQEARRRWERMCQIRKDKFDLILPEVMRENGIDMWITTPSADPGSHCRDPLRDDEEHL